MGYGNLPRQEWWCVRHVPEMSTNPSVPSALVGFWPDCFAPLCLVHVTPLLAAELRTPSWKGKALKGPPGRSKNIDQVLQKFYQDLPRFKGESVSSNPKVLTNIMTDFLSNKQSKHHFSQHVSRACRHISARLSLTQVGSAGKHHLLSPEASCILKPW